MESADVAIIGAGQAGLATAYYLRHAALSCVLFDAHPSGGGSWVETWESLRLFSPARISSLPGWPLPTSTDHYPAPQDMVSYFQAYEDRYGFDVRRPVSVLSVTGTGPFVLRCSDGSDLQVRAVVNATGNASRPFVPFVPGISTFRGTQLHSHSYRSPDRFSGQSVVVVGGGNSGAQIAADLHGHANVTWCTLRPPRYLPDSYDGEQLFSFAQSRIAALNAGETGVPLSELGDIIAVPPVRRARDAGLLTSREMFVRLAPSGVEFRHGDFLKADAIIWCTGFRPALRHLSAYRFTRDSQHQIALDGTESRDVPGIYFVGYGDWVGPAADTVIGVGPFAKETARSIIDQLR